MDKFTIGYIWLLSLLGALFSGNELAMMQYDSHRLAMNERLQSCNKIIAGSIYE